MLISLVISFLKKSINCLFWFLRIMRKRNNWLCISFLQLFWAIPYFDILIIVIFALIHSQSILDFLLSLRFLTSYSVTIYLHLQLLLILVPNILFHRLFFHLTLYISCPLVLQDQIPGL